MDWIVFGDDWSAHPSTTKHLVRSMSSEQRVVWIDSVGMRTPRFTRADLKRLVDKAHSLTHGHVQSAEETLTSATIERIQPKVVPFHLNRAARLYNRLWLGRAVRESLRRLSVTEPPAILASVPVASFYLNALPHRGVAYLRLDDYPRLPGCDLDLAEAAEQQMFRRADLILSTARSLLPPQWSAKCHYLPQGVNWDLFSQAAIDPPKSLVLGFFGLIAEWLDFDLVERVAAAAPNWQLEFIGPARHLPEAIRKIPNVSILPAVPFASLPRAVARWTAAWIPFEVSELTRSVNPLKAREYLAAGLPTHCTPLPEIASLPDAFISNDAEAIVGWMSRCAAEDSSEKRLQRQHAMQPESWTSRFEQLELLMKRYRQ